MTLIFPGRETRTVVGQHAGCLISSSGWTIKAENPGRTEAGAMCTVSFMSIVQGYEWNGTCSYVEGLKEEIVTYEL